MRQARHWVRDPGASEVGSASPQRSQTAPVWRGNSVQQTSQIGTEESRGRSEPHREQEAGSSVQLKLSKGLRSTRTTARQLVVADGGTWFAVMTESLRKTHLAWGAMPLHVARCRQYTAFLL